LSFLSNAAQRNEAVFVAAAAAAAAAAVIMGCN
jgi:hypothetical protein